MTPITSGRVGKRAADRMRAWIIERSFAAGVGHIGSSLSIVDIMAVLWHDVMTRPGTDHPDRDRFILAKGHASLALYAAMHSTGQISAAEFETYCQDGTRLGVHPEHSLPGIEASTGSLGQGLSIACGQAYGLRQQKSAARVWALLSDAECNEGQVWEAAMFAAHHKLANLTAIIDLNGLQAMGETNRIIDMGNHFEKWRSFGWNAVEVDGHDAEELATVLSSESVGAPRVVIARTVLGKHVPFMEGKVEWHYRPLTPPLRQEALAAMEART